MPLPRPHQLTHLPHIMGKFEKEEMMKRRPLAKKQLA